jgi:uncharacterized protein (DUF1778 family)
MREKRTKSIEVSLTLSERDEIAEAAKCEGLPLATFIRMAALREARS